jgi:hypothetical protein
MACVTGSKGGGGTKGTKRYLPLNEWKALSADAKSKIIESWKIKPLQMTTKKLSTMMSTFQMWDNDDDNLTISTVDGTFDLCSKEDFMPKIVKGNNACKVLQVNYKFVTQSRLVSLIMFILLKAT